MYIRLAQRLVGADYSVLRFSFRATARAAVPARRHGGRGDVGLEAALTYAHDRGVPLTVVASSFGAVATLHTADYLHPTLCAVESDSRSATHIRRPELEWGRQNFHAQAWAQAKERAVSWSMTPSS